MPKFIFITGGVISSLGKGITSATIAALLKARGFKVRNRKMDPYINVDPGTLSPFQHGEIFVTDDGVETDLDLGHYERYTDTPCSQNDSISAGRIYWNVLTRERRGGYGGRNIQIIPEITDEVKAFITDNVKDEDFIIYEIGGTVGEDEGFIFTEGVRQLINKLGPENTLLIHLTYAPFLKATGEIKTKPTQQSSRMLMERGLAADIILCRSEDRLPAEEKEKISMYCNVGPRDVISAPDVKNIYELPITYHAEGVDDRILAYFKITAPKPDLSDWERICKLCDARSKNITVGMIVKYHGLPDAYKSVIEAINHAGINNNANIEIDWINAEELESMSGPDVAACLGDLDAMIVPGGFGARGTKGKIIAAKYARENNVPYLGISLGMQTAVIEMIQNLLGIHNENSFPDWANDETGRLGSFETVITPNTLAHKIYGADRIHERHRHNYEMDISYEKARREKGIVISGKSPDGTLPEIIEIPAHKFFIAGQFHPEFQSRPYRPAPLFDALIKVALTGK